MLACDARRKTSESLLFVCGHRGSFRYPFFLVYCGCGLCVYTARKFSLSNYAVVAVGSAVTPVLHAEDARRLVLAVARDSAHVGFPAAGYSRRSCRMDELPETEGVGGSASIRMNWGARGVRLPPPTFYCPNVSGGFDTDVLAFS